MWTMWHIKYAEVMGLYAVYANLEWETDAGGELKGAGIAL